MRTPSQSANEALAACVAAYGSVRTAESANNITFGNRGQIRAWLTANRVPSVIAQAASLAQLRACWADTTDSEIDALACRDTRGAPPPQDDDELFTPAEVREIETERNDDSMDTLDLVRQNRAKPNGGARRITLDAPPKTAATDDAAAYLSAALAALMQQQPIDESAVRAIVTQELSDNLGALQDLQDLTRKAIADMISGAPRKLEIVIDGKPLGTLEALRHFRTEQLLQVVACGIPAYVVGPAGSGKTTAADQVAKALAFPFYLQGAASGAHEFLGFIDAHGNYQGTPFRQAFEHGGVFLADEVDGSDPAALLVINAALANGHMAFPDQPAPVARHADFRMIAAANTYGNGADRQYVGRSQLDAATLDRFAMIDWPYDERLESTLAGNEDWTRFVQRARASVARLSIRHVISPRASIMGAKLLASGMDRATVEALTVWKGLTDADKARIEAGM